MTAEWMREAKHTQMVDVPREIEHRTDIRVDGR